MPKLPVIAAVASNAWLAYLLTRLLVSNISTSSCGVGPGMDTIWTAPTYDDPVCAHRYQLAAKAHSPWHTLRLATVSGRRAIRQPYQSKGSFCKGAESVVGSAGGLLALCRGVARRHEFKVDSCHPCPHNHAGVRAALALALDAPVQGAVIAHIELFTWL